jgi:hypothetical protein
LLVVCTRLQAVAVVLPVLQAAEQRLRYQEHTAAVAIQNAQRKRVTAAAARATSLTSATPVAFDATLAETTTAVNDSDDAPPAVTADAAVDNTLATADSNTALSSTDDDSAMLAAAAAQQQHEAAMRQQAAAAATAAVTSTAQLTAAGVLVVGLAQAHAAAVVLQCAHRKIAAVRRVTLLKEQQWEQEALRAAAEDAAQSTVLGNTASASIDSDSAGISDAQAVAALAEVTAPAAAVQAETAVPVEQVAAVVSVPAPVQAVAETAKVVRSVPSTLQQQLQAMVSYGSADAHIAVAARELVASVLFSGQRRRVARIKAEQRHARAAAAAAAPCTTVSW